jgi:hypothetical protein
VDEFVKTKDPKKLSAVLDDEITLPDGTSGQIRDVQPSSSWWGGKTKVKFTINGEKRELPIDEFEKVLRGQ